MIRRPPRSTLSSSSAASDVYKRQLDDLAAVVLEYALETGHLLVAEGEVLGDGHRALIFEFLGGIVAHHVAALRRSRRRPDDERIGLALGHVFRRGEADERRLVVTDVIGDRQQL